MVHSPEEYIQAFLSVAAIPKDVLKSALSCVPVGNCGFFPETNKHHLRVRRDAFHWIESMQALVLEHLNTEGTSYESCLSFAHNLTT